MRDARSVAEEARHGEESIAERAAKQAGCSYLNIEMTPEERRLRKIPNDYNELPDLPQSEKDRFNRDREEYMVNKVLTETNEAAHILVICGRMHKDALVRRFQDLGHSTEYMDLLDQDWYVEDWIDHMLHNL